MGLKFADTDVLVDIRRQWPAAMAWFRALKTYPVVPGFVALEQFAGWTDKTASREMASFLAPFPTMWPTAAAGETALAGFPKWHLSHKMGVLDVLIAATVLEVGGTLYTFNTKHFRAVDGLVLEQPYTR